MFIFEFGFVDLGIGGIDDWCFLLLGLFWFVFLFGLGFLFFGSGIILSGIIEEVRLIVIEWFFLCFGFLFDDILCIGGMVEFIWL